MNPSIDNMTKINQKLAARLRELRHEHKLSQMELGRLLQICQTTYGDYENARISMKANMLAVLADYYGTTTDYLLGRTDIK